MRQILTTAMLLFLASNALADTPADQLLVPRLLIYSMESKQPTLHAIGNLPAVKFTAPILIYDKKSKQKKVSEPLEIETLRNPNQPPESK